MSAPRTTTTMTMTSGNSVPPWNRTFLPLPFWASLATLLADDDVATSLRGYSTAVGFPLSPRPAGTVTGGRLAPGHAPAFRTREPPRRATRRLPPRPAPGAPSPSAAARRRAV